MASFIHRSLRKPSLSKRCPGRLRAEAPHLCSTPGLHVLAAQERQCERPATPQGWDLSSADPPRTPPARVHNGFNLGRPKHGPADTAWCSAVSTEETAWEERWRWGRSDRGDSNARIRGALGKEGLGNCPVENETGKICSATQACGARSLCCPSDNENRPARPRSRQLPQLRGSPDLRRPAPAYSSESLPSGTSHVPASRVHQRTAKLPGQATPQFGSVFRDATTGSQPLHTRHLSTHSRSQAVPGALRGVQSQPGGPWQGREVLHDHGESLFTFQGTGLYAVQDSLPGLHWRRRIQGRRFLRTQNTGRSNFAGGSKARMVS